MRDWDAGWIWTRVGLATLIDRALIALERRRALGLRRLRLIASTRATSNGDIAWLRVPHSAQPVFLPGLAVASL